MIVEVFVKGTNLQAHFWTHWNIERIERDGDNFILVTEGITPNIIVDSTTHELRVNI